MSRCYTEKAIFGLKGGELSLLSLVTLGMCNGFPFPLSQPYCISCRLVCT
ncbi:hypothetical protein Syun_014318 [Stephania yunnanensis]|uniref:Uncharacterized protein n=1 Tax=Stephania yunnanensis TaxID=152371 RepID=A0AAP0JKT0_9MAGN